MTVQVFTESLRDLIFIGLRVAGVRLLDLGYGSQIFEASTRPTGCTLDVRSTPIFTGYLLKLRFT